MNDETVTIQLKSKKFVIFHNSEDMTYADCAAKQSLISEGLIPRNKEIRSELNPETGETVHYITYEGWEIIE